MLVPKRDFDIFDNFFYNSNFLNSDNKVMKTDIKELKDKFIINIDLPGYEKENIKVDVTNGYLNILATISENVENEEEKYLRRERCFEECSRSFYVGENLKEEDIEASFKNGILKIVLPKVENDSNSKEKKYIEISD